ncbi:MULTISPECIES: sensor domain-containing diguanylate cyclase [unclassified Guyparkeria]|uniref:sensor domain-containing diguanylate cyclase n=1 Tax=unclassified Guyparkeria TaxID=2626246 RepID=UPI00073368A8|nr:MULTISPECIES: sensor domain-containing diguanylate cyclase [unclassified Guyparkeria]KTG16335.1 diguanylate cyclase [Guyparkeria sp. XI15]OAE85275.1 diguanylate cyclase [Guyparkeria sp. WRN-7]
MQPKKRLFIIVLTSLLAVGFVATSLVSYFIAEDSLKSQIADESLPLTSDNIFSEIERDLLRSILISSLMAHDTFVRDWARNGEDDPQRIIRYLDQIQSKYDTTTAFFVSEATRRYYHPDGVIKTVSRSEPADAWFFRVREMNEPFEINIDHDTADPSRLSIFVNYRVVDRDGEFLGTTGIGLAVDTVAGLIANYQRRYGREIYFVDREGRVTMHGEGYVGPGSIQEQPGLAKYTTRILTSPSTSLSYENSNGREVFVNTRLIPEFDWFLIVEQSRSAADKRLMTTLVVNILLALGVAALVIVIGGLTLRSYQGRLESMATTDKLTGAANRQAFDLLFEQARRVARRRNEPLSLITLDVDHFKQINDQHGHQAGDEVLKTLVATVQSEIRDSDTLCRWGGDEFLVLMQDADLERARQTADRLLEATSRRLRTPGGEPVGISEGVAQFRPGESADALIQRADLALYRAKHEGRNRVATETVGSD